MRKCANLPVLPHAPTATLADTATRPINPRISFSRFGAGFTSADALLPKGHHRQWLEVNQDDHMRRIGNEVREKERRMLCDDCRSDGASIEDDFSNELFLPE